ncbi:MAG: hypothetical protein WEB60_09685 [Terrimicrobiaceae bacterium]
MNQFLLTAGKTTLAFYPDGTIQVEQGGNLKDLEEICLFLKPPKRLKSGKEWWPFFLIHKIDELHGLEAAKGIASALYPSNPTRQANPRNFAFAKWLLDEGLHKHASVESITNAKSSIWDSNKEQPRTDARAKRIIKDLKVGKRWKDISQK